MFDTSGGVADSRVLEVASAFRRLPLGAPHEAPHIVEQLRFVPGALATHGVSLDVLIDKLIGVEMRAVARQEEQPDLVPMTLHPALHPSRDVYGMLVHDQEDRAPRVADQALQEADEHRRHEAPLEHRECQAPRLVMAESRLQRNRLPVPGMMGVCPRP